MSYRRWSPGRTILLLTLVALLTSTQALAQDRTVRVMAPHSIADSLPDSAQPLHDYGDTELVAIAAGEAGRVPTRAARIEDTSRLSYRAWSGLVEDRLPEHLPDSTDGYFLLALIGPMDARWRTQIEATGLVAVDHAHPYGLVVRGDSSMVGWAAESIQTSHGYPVITRALPLPESSRVAQDVSEWLTGRTAPADMGMRMQDGTPIVRVVLHADARDADGRASVLEHLEPGPEYRADARAGQHLASAQDLTALLEDVPEVAYVHGVYPKQLHNNIGAQEHITNIEPVWTELNYTGSGLIAGINDSGMDLEHDDFPPDSVVATLGAMSGTDNGHGTHTTGTMAGRGAAPSPENTFECGDVTAPLPDARGMAWEAQIAHNNIFEGGSETETAMMEWHAEQGAVINNNSWGYASLFGPVTTYDSESVDIDIAVRDALPDTTDINEQLSIVFSAGNFATSGVSKPGNAKNVITAGASQNDRCGSYIPSECAGPDIDSIACFSSQGPSQGRFKPDIVAPGTDVLSTGSSDPEATWGGWDQDWTGDEYAIVPGTSMSAPMITGAATVFMQYYQDEFGQLPSPALVKAALVNTATDLGEGLPSNIQGWGRLNLRKAIEGPLEDGIVYFDQDQVDHLETGESWTTEIGVASADEPLRITLTWTDPPGADGCNPCHINDLDLVVTAPDGTVYRGNQFVDDWAEPDPTGRDEDNNLENVYIEAPDSGDWVVEIEGTNVAENPPLLDGQDFALVSTGDFGGVSVEPPEAAACTTEGSFDYTLTLSSQFEGTTNLSADSLPAGTSGQFDPNPVVFPDKLSVFTLSDLGLASAGDYTLIFTATDDADPENTADSDVALALFENAPGQVNLTAPADGATDQDLEPEFSWDTPAEADTYRIQVATSTDFTAPLIDETLEGTTFVPAEALATGTDYFWRVRSENACGDGDWSSTFTFQTRFEPIADISPLSFEFDVDIGEQVDGTLSIGNTGTGNLVWDIDTDAIDQARAGRGHDPSLDEPFDLPEFTVEGSETPDPVEFTVDAGQLTRGDVIGFHFVGTASGISGEASWASDTCMVIEAPDGSTHSVGGFSDDALPECDGEDDWDFQGSGSGDDGTYESEHDDFIDPPIPDQGQWTITFVNDYTSTSAVDITWSDVTVTLLKQLPPVCIEDLADVPWLSADPAFGSTGAGQTDEVTVTADAAELQHGVHEAYLCLTTNDTSDQNQTLVPIPVEVTVFDPDAAANLTAGFPAPPYWVAEDEPFNLDILVTNEGPSNVSDARVISGLDDTALSDISWSCVAEDGASCPSASGTGQLDELIPELPVDGRVIFTMEATMGDAGDAEQSTQQVMAETPVGIPDPVPSQAFDEIVIFTGLFADRFE